MKFLAFYFSFVSTLAFAQTMGIKDISTDGDTTIKIQKGKEEDKYEITTGTDAIEGDAAPLLKEARANWKTACSEWKKELKELNKENQVISLSCGTMKCSTTAMETTCASEGKNKVRVKVK
ncbi:MAG TPA: hypothetical protein VIG33_02505 [Pseudobdellovibrionaceae bacterium]|jgi:hypothetical protein